MDTKAIEFEGKTIDEAIQRACEHFSMPREKLNIEIITEGSAGFLGGLVGAKKACVRASIMSIDLGIEGLSKNETLETHDVSEPAEPEPREGKEDLPSLASEAQERLEGILTRMGIDFPIHAEDTPDSITLRIEGDGSGLLIGKGGQTLDALQYIVNKTSNRTGKHRKRIILDTEDYRKRREKTLIALAEKLGQKVKRTKKPITVNPMNAHDRRIIHLALQDDKQLTTKSRGEGNYRKIIILPSKKE